MQNFKVPGVAYVVVLVLVMTLGRSFIEQQGWNPIYLDVLVVGGVAVMKALNLGTKEIEELLDVIGILQKQIDRREAELSAAGKAVVQETAKPMLKEYPINYFARWLVG